ncbi:hypothetical protein H0H81_005302 [Sphagnurus paluster]|uniref:Uncharacterized protein n=1 Tax=Sphagnurus paluster TaxID=117069 RepID=A0A9P7FZH6_9AGAR|nr:hypothetical protein H0H81_005302 [Sphagnurus paluster]
MEKDSINVASIVIKPSAPLMGDLLTLVASIGYGLYQVLYKKYAVLSTDLEISSEGFYDHIPVDDPPHYDATPNAIDHRATVHPSPFGLHANLLTTCMGLSTFALLWIPLPFLHYYGIETFRLPPNITTILAIAGIALSGVVFNAGFMVLLGVWGPIITSVGNLLTIVLVFISDVGSNLCLVYSSQF